MNRKRIILLTLGVLILLTGIWAFLKINLFVKVDSCLDKGGRWNYETNECEFADPEVYIRKQRSDSVHGYDQLADEQNRKAYTSSEYNTDLENENIKRPNNSIIKNPTIDTTQLFRMWTIDPDGPHADFWFTRTVFYVVDYYGDGAMPYIINQDSLTIFYNDFVKKGRIIFVNRDTLKIHWNECEKPTKYVKWEN